MMFNIKLNRLSSISNNIFNIVVIPHIIISVVGQQIIKAFTAKSAGA